MSLINTGEGNDSNDQANEGAEVQEQDTGAAGESGAGEEGQENQGQEEEQDEQLILGKFKTYEDLEKGYKEATKKLREKIPEAPEEYSFDFTDDEAFKEYSHLDLKLALNDDPMAQAVAPIFKKHNISQEAAADIAKAVIKYELGNVRDPGEEKKALGEEADALIQNAESFVQKNFTKDEQQILAGLATTADGVRLVNKLRQMSGSKPIPGEGGGAPALSSREYMDKAMKIKNETENFNFNTSAQKEYEKYMDLAAKAES